MISTLFTIFLPIKSTLYPVFYQISGRGILPCASPLCALPVQCSTVSWSFTTAPILICAFLLCAFPVFMCVVILHHSSETAIPLCFTSVSWSFTTAVAGWSFTRVVQNAQRRYCLSSSRFTSVQVCHDLSPQQLQGAASQQTAWELRS